ncbi:hypothetical protein [Kineosporia sp. A_224]|uniref:hypothetical protein n=1 Tax=Kineosporia sp. A_224 TaxID=1962180 RepID=UPI000B4AB5E2|nr:hypothetical protein [Kineosporia sp. A_224]
MVAQAPPAVRDTPRPAAATGRTVTLGGRRVPVLDLVAWALTVVGAELQARALRAAGPTLEEVARQAAVARRGLVAVLVDPGALAVSGAPGGPAGGILTRAAVWLVATVAPLRELVVAIAANSLRVSLALGVWLLLRRLLRPSPLLLVPLAMVMTAPQLIASGAGTTDVAGPLAATVALVWAAVAHVWWSGGRRLGAVALLTTLAMGCDRSGVLVPLVLLLLSATVVRVPPDLQDGPPGPDAVPSGARAVLRGLRAAWPPAAASAAVVAVFVALPGLRPADLVLPADAAVAGVVGDVLRAVAGGLLGAPWTWSAAEVQGLPRPATGVVTAAVLLVGGLLLLAARHDRGRALRAVALGAGWSVAALVVGVPGRPQAPGAVLGVTVAVVLTGALATLAPRGARLPDDAAADLPPGRLPRLRALAPRALALALPVLVVLAAVPASTGFGRRAAADPAPAWAAAVRSTLADLAPFPRITSRAVPAPVAASSGAAGTLDTDIVTLLRPDALVHDADGPVLSLDDTGGRLVTARLDRLGGAARTELCAAVVQPGDTSDARVTMTTPVDLPPGAQIRLELLVTGSARLRVVVEGPDGQATAVRRWSDDVLYEGPHTVLFPVGPQVGTAAAVRVRPATPDAGVCVVAADVVRAR